MEVLNFQDLTEKQISILFQTDFSVWNFRLHSIQWQHAWWIGKDVPILRCYASISPWGLRKPLKTSVKIVGVPNEIWTGNFPSTSHEHYCLSHITAFLLLNNKQTTPSIRMIMVGNVSMNQLLNKICLSPCFCPHCIFISMEFISRSWFVTARWT